MKYGEQIVTFFLFAVAVILAVILARPGPKFAGAEFIIPVAPPLVRVGEEPITIGSSDRPEISQAARMNDQDTLIPDLVDLNKALVTLNPKLTEIVTYLEKRDSLERKRGQLKLKIESRAVQIGQMLPFDVMTNIYLDRVKLIARFGEMKDFDERLKQWPCANETGGIN